MSSISGHLILLMAPSGSGKGTLLESLGDIRDQLYFAKTYTSRTPRPGVTENPKYVFVSKEEFERLVAAGEFIEWANFSGNLYGTPKSEILEPLAVGKVVFKEMELQGIEQMRAIVGKDRMTVLYIEAGGWEALKVRIMNRAPITEAELALRKERYEEEAKAKHTADVIIENPDGGIEKATETFRQVISDIIKQNTHS